MPTKIALCTFLLILLAGLGHGQKVIRWASPDLPKECCNNYFSNGKLTTGYHDDTVEIVVILNSDFDDKYLAAFVGVFNKGGDPIDVDPVNFSFRATDPKPQEYPNIPFDDVARDMEKRGRWAMAFRALAASFPTTTTTQTTGTSNGTVYNGTGRQVATVNGTYNGSSTTSQPNVAAQQQAVAANAQQVDKNQRLAGGVRSFALKHNTVFKDQDVSGVVFFKEAGKGKNTGWILAIKIGDTTYEVPYGSERTGKK